MRLCQLFSSYQDSESPFRDIDPAYDAARWLPEHDWTIRPIVKASAAATVDELVAQGFDVFINLCDGEPGEDIAGIEVVEQLERRGVPFTGADSHCYAIGSSRRALKQACAAAGVGTPAFAFTDGKAAPPEDLRFPILVKPPGGYASIGIERSSRVTTPEALRVEVARTAARFGGALLEEFIEGREFTVLCTEPPAGGTEPLALPPIEVVFPAGESFKHFDLKWQEHANMAARPVEDAGLAAALGRMVQRLFAAMNGVGYVRCDIRMDAAGGLYLLDCNPNPGMFYPPGQYGAADLILAREPDGHRRFLEHIIDCARRRYAGPRSASTITPS